MNAYSVYLLTCFVQALLFTVIGTYTALYRINIVGLNPLELVLVGTVLEITTFLFEVPTGVVADIYSRKISTVIGLILIGIGFMVESLFPIFAIVLIAQAIWGIGFTFTSGAREAWIAGEVGGKRANIAFMKAARLTQIGSFIGVLISMCLALVSVRLPIFVGALLYSIWGIIMYFIMPEKKFKPVKHEEETTWQHFFNTFSSGISVIKQNSLLILIISGLGIFGMFAEGFDRLWTVHMIKNFSFPDFINVSQTTWFGIIYLLTLVCAYLGIGIVGRFTKTDQTRSLIKTILWILMFMILFAFVFSTVSFFYGAAFSVMMIFMLRESTGPLYNSLLNKETIKNSRATVFSIASQANALGQIIGGPLLGFTATLISIQYGMEYAAFSIVPVLFLFYIAYKMAGGKISKS
jgi:DHA3 family tetracycline resistance protein-like MFS transporter